MMFMILDGITYLLSKGFIRKYRLTRFKGNRPLGHLENDDIQKLLDKYNLDLEQFEGV